MLGLFLDTLTIGNKFCSLLNILNELTLQKASSMPLLRDPPPTIGKLTLGHSPFFPGLDFFLQDFVMVFLGIHRVGSPFLRTSSRDFWSVTGSHALQRLVLRYLQLSKYRSRAWYKTIVTSYIK